MADGRLLRHTLRMITYGALNRNSSIKPSWRTRLARPCSLYGLSCFAYTVVGLHSMALWLLCPQAIPEWPPHIAVPESFLVAVQGLWSFASDVVHVGQPSTFHVVDRVSALVLVAAQLAKFCWLLPRSLSVAERAWIWGGLAIGIACKVGGFKAVISGGSADFHRWHILWHLSLPLTFGAFHASRWHSCAVCGE